MLKLTAKVGDKELSIEIKSTKIAKEIRDQLKKQDVEVKLMSYREI